MDSEIIARLDAIADLMKQRLELEQRRETNLEAQRSEALERMREFKFEMPRLDMPKMESHEEFTAKLEQAAERDRLERRTFEEALLTEMRRQSEALEKLAQNQR